ncbi:MAG: helix-hairpin-helix domain-containing protein [Ruminococcus sp.]|nr:helix-hairpin-helix domain-containing protein [Ruminococcus sp.]
MADKTKRTALAKYTVAAIAAVLIIGVAVTTVLIKAKRKDIVVIEANKESADSLEESFKSKEEKKSTAESKAETVMPQTTVKTDNSFPIDINKADLAQLCSIDGIGESTAQRILDYRNKVGVISSLDMLLNVDGIGGKTLKKLENYLFVSDTDKSVAAQTTQTSKTATTKTQEKTFKQVNINTAEAKEIAQALQISLEKARLVVETRGKIGGYTAKPQILLSKAISEDDFNRLEQYILI